MKFLVVTQIFHSVYKNEIFAYGPYSIEMNLWFSKVDEVHIISPVRYVKEINPIEVRLKANSIIIHEVPSFDTTNTLNILKSIFSVPYIFFILLKQMFLVDHIHLRCPGNMGLLGALAQIFFPLKKKTAKYAGNWDFNSNQPISYRIQQLILKSTILSHNIQVLIYGNWPNLSKNILPFFTASYTQNQIQSYCSKVPSLHHGPLKLIFVGSLEPNKNPILSLEVAKIFKENSFNFEFNFFGEGSEFDKLIRFTKETGLSEYVHFHGNVTSDKIIHYFKMSHFLVFLSESEGWPKVVAEAMFWGCIPITSAVSCVPEMVGNGDRGILVSKNPKEVFIVISRLISNPDEFEKISQSAKNWANQFTLEKFGNEINKLV